MTTTVIVVIVALLLCVIGLRRIAYAREKTTKSNGSYAHKFVWVEDDGTARQLTPDEIEYLNTEFLPGDGARPHIKASYSSRTPDGRIGGFLRKSSLPRHTIAVLKSSTH